MPPTAQLKQVTPYAVTFVKENRRFMQRAAYYVAHQGVTRFIDIGTGPPTAGPLHEVVQEVHPNARTIYIDNDSVVLAHAHALMAGDAQTEVVGGDITAPENILANEHVAGMLADGEPVGVLTSRAFTCARRPRSNDSPKKWSSSSLDWCRLRNGRWAEAQSAADGVWPYWHANHNALSVI